MRLVWYLSIITIIHILLILIITAVVDNFKTTTTGCPTGYTGHDCKKTCRYPSFGIDCQLRCCCAQNRCNHMFGCNTSYINGKRKFLALFLSNLQWKYILLIAIQIIKKMDIDIFFLIRGFYQISLIRLLLLIYKGIRIYHLLKVQLCLQKLLRWSQVLRAMHEFSSSRTK